MSEDREKTKRELLTRLKRVEGQVRGLQRMIDEGQQCASIVTQISAVRAALDQVGLMLLSHSMVECVRERIERGEDGQRAIEDAVRLFMKLGPDSLLSGGREE